LLPCSFEALDGEGRVWSAASLHSIGGAMSAYYSSNHRLPPAVATDQDGRPLYSWRVELLPYLGEDDLYERFRRDEPWDSPHNRGLLEPTPHCFLPSFGGHSDPPGTTRYRVFVGPGTAFERPGLGLTQADFPDGLGNTLLVVEAAEAVPWTKPEELTYDPAGPLPPLGAGYSKADKFLCYEVRRRLGFNALFADGTVRFLMADKADERSLRALITRNGGEQVDVSKLEE
jgi:hypothetical protein